MPADTVRPRARLGWAMLTMAPLFWAGNIIVARAMADEIPPIGLTFWRWTIAVLVILPFVLPAFRGQWPVIRREIRFIAALAILGVTTFPIFMYTGLQTTSAINAGFIQALCPVMIPIVAWLARGERISRFHMIGIAVSGLGALAIVSAGDPLGLLAKGGTVGDLWVLAATTNWAIYSVIVERRPPDLDPNVLLATTMALGAVLTLPFWLGELATHKAVPLDLMPLLALGYIAIFPSIGSYFFYNRGLEIVGPSRGGLSLHLIPMFTALMAVALLGEPFRLYHAAGVGLIALGIVIVARAKRLTA